MTANQTHKRLIKWRLAESNRLVSLGYDADPWVVQFREKNNKTKSNWKSKQPKIEYVYKANSGSFKKGMKPANALSPEEKQLSKIRTKEYRRVWFLKNKDRVNEYKRKKRAENPSFRIACNLRKRLSFALKSNACGKYGQTMRLLGCSMSEFMNHLKELFQEGMTFEKYGEWHIDHKVPCALFDLSDRKQQELCFHYSNLQPLWAIDNLVKNKRLIQIK